jgi:hypothetical protein
MLLRPTSSTVTDSSGMNLFDSGAQTLVSYFSFTFSNAGSYSYKDTLHPTLTGKINVPMSISPSSGTTTTTFTVKWASAPPAAGFVSDVQIKRPGSVVYVDWMIGQTGTSATFTPDAGAGTYSFHTRLRETGNGTHSGFSPAKSITVT